MVQFPFSFAGGGRNKEGVCAPPGARQWEKRKGGGKDRYRRGSPTNRGGEKKKKKKKKTMPLSAGFVTNLSNRGEGEKEGEEGEVVSWPNSSFNLHPRWEGKKKKERNAVVTEFGGGAANRCPREKKKRGEELRKHLVIWS